MVEKWQKLLFSKSISGASSIVRFNVILNTCLVNISKCPRLVNSKLRQTLGWVYRMKWVIQEEVGPSTCPCSIPFSASFFKQFIVIVPDGKIERLIILVQLSSYLFYSMHYSLYIVAPLVFKEMDQNGLFLENCCRYPMYLFSLECYPILIESSVRDGFTVFDVMLEHRSQSESTIYQLPHQDLTFVQLMYVSVFLCSLYYDGTVVRSILRAFFQFWCLLFCFFSLSK